MIYKFKSPATGDVIMLGPQGNQLLQLLGRAPSAQGIIEPVAMAAAIAALEAAIATDAKDAKDAQGGAGPDEDTDATNQPKPVGLRARLWPVVEMLRRAQAADAPVTWGV